MFIKIKHLAPIALLLALGGGFNHASAQAIWGDEALKRYAMFAPGRIPTSYALAYRWQMRVDLSHQLYFKQGIKTAPNMDTYKWVSPQFLALELDKSRDWRLGLSLTPWNRITIGLALSTSYRCFEWINERMLRAHTAYIDHDMAEFLGSFHDVFGGNFAYEVRYMFCSSRIRFRSNESSVKMDINDALDVAAAIVLLTPLDDLFDGTMHSQSITGGLSVFNNSRSVQGTLQLNTEYAYLRAYEYKNPNLLYDVWQRLRNQHGFLQFTPSLMFAYHTKRVFSLQMHVGLPICLLDGHLYAPCPTWGVQLSFRAIKAHRNPSAYSVAP